MTLSRTVWLPLCALLLALFLFTSAYAASSPHEEFLDEAALLIGANNSMLDQIPQFTMFGVQVLRTDFTNKARDFRPFRLSTMSSYTSLDNNVKQYYRKVVESYDALMAPMVVFFNTVGRDATTEIFRISLHAVAGSGPVFEWDLRGYDRLYDTILAEHGKVIKGLEQMKKDFGYDIRSKLNDISSSRLNSDNKMREFFKKNHKLWPPKKSEKNKYPITTIYGITAFNSDIKDKVKKFDVFAAQMKLVPKYLEYVMLMCEKWKRLNRDVGGNRLADVRTISQSSQWGKYPGEGDLQKALLAAVKVHTAWYEHVGSQLEKFDNREVSRAKAILGNSKVSSIIKGASNIYKGAGGYGNSVEGAFDDLWRQMWRYFEEGAR